MKLSEIVIMSDLDGTLLYELDKIPDRNIQAIHRFIQKGGRFGIATGRSTAFAEDIAKRLPINIPCVTYNGCAVYDFSRREYLMQTHLPSDSFELCLAELREKFKQVRFLVVDENYYYDISPEDDSEIWQIRPSPYVRRAPNLDVSGKKWIKTVMRMDPSLVEKFVNQALRISDKFEYSLSFPEALEMMPKGVSKWSALQSICKIEGVSPDNLVCIGDYYNDYEMIKHAGIGVTMSTAPDNIKELANIIVDSCENGAIADLIEILEEK